MRITIYVHNEDLENLRVALASPIPGRGDVIIPPVRVLNQTTEEYVQVSLMYDEYVKCTDLGIFEELLSL
jgi:hypothetical protein